MNPKFRVKEDRGVNQTRIHSLVSVGSDSSDGASPFVTTSSSLLAATMKVRRSSGVSPKPQSPRARTGEDGASDLVSRGQVDTSPSSSRGRGARREEE